MAERRQHWIFIIVRRRFSGPPALLSFTEQAACTPRRWLAFTVPTPVSCPSLCVNLWTPERRWELIYSSLQENTACSVFTARPHCSGYENGLCLRKWCVVSSTCRRLVRSQMTCTCLIQFQEAGKLYKKDQSNVIWFRDLSSFLSTVILKRFLRFLQWEIVNSFLQNAWR